MSDSKAYSYETNLDVRFRPLEVIDVNALAEACTHKWYNQPAPWINGSRRIPFRM